MFPFDQWKKLDDVIVGKKVFGLEDAVNPEALLRRNNAVGDLLVAGVLALTTSYANHELQLFADPALGEGITYACIGLAGMYGLSATKHYLASKRPEHRNID